MQREIVRWGKRMTDTTISSEKVVYRAAKKIIPRKCCMFSARTNGR